MFCEMGMELAVAQEPSRSARSCRRTCGSLRQMDLTCSSPKFCCGKTPNSEMMKLIAQERPHVLMRLAAPDEPTLLALSCFVRLRLRDVGEAWIRLRQKRVGRLRLLPVGVGRHHGVSVGRDLLHRQRHRLRAPHFPQRIALADAGPLPRVNRYATLQIGKGKRLLPVAAVGRADEGEQRVVLRNRYQRTIAEGPPRRREVATEHTDLTNIWLTHDRVSSLSLVA